MMCMAARLPAQTAVERFDRQLDQIRRQTSAIPETVPIDQRALFDYGAFLDFNYFSIDDSNGRPHGLRQYELFPYARINFDGANEIYLRGIIGYQDWNKNESFDGRGDQPIDGDLDRGFYRFDMRGYESAYHHRDIGYDLTVKGGRDLVYWGNGVTLSQVIDGMVVDAGYGPFNVEAIAGVTPTRTVDIDSSRPNFDHNTERGFFGALLGQRIGAHHPFIYGLVQQDYNQDDLLVSQVATSTITTEFEYNSYYIAGGSNGSITDKLLYGIEIVYEGGDTLSNSFNQSTVQQFPRPRPR